MEKLLKQSEGFWQTPDGNRAVTNLRRSLPHGDAYFEYKSAPYAEVTRLEWDDQAKFALFPADVSSLLVERGWGSYLGDEIATDFNNAIDALTDGPEIIEPAIPPIPEKMEEVAVIKTDAVSSEVVTALPSSSDEVQSEKLPAPNKFGGKYKYKDKSK